MYILSILTTIYHSHTFQTTKSIILIFIRYFGTKMLFSLLFACTTSSEKDSSHEEDINPLDWNVNQAGPYRTGYTSVEETYTDFAGEERTITVNIWYPTDDEEGDIGVYVGYLEDENVLLNARISDSVHEDGYPLFIFSHGSFGYGGNSPFLMHHLTSHGFVVLAPDHKGNSYSTMEKIKFQ